MRHSLWCVHMHTQRYTHTGVCIKAQVCHFVGDTEEGTQVERHHRIQAGTVQPVNKGQMVHLL